MTDPQPRSRIVAGVRRIGAVAIIAIAVLLFTSQVASAHVVPWTTIQLDVQDGHILATVNIPLDDVAASTGISLGQQTQADVDAHTVQITDYLQHHFKPTSDTGKTWTVTTGALTVLKAGDKSTTGLYQQLSTTFTLTPPAGDDGRSLNLGYTAIVEKVITHVIVVTVHSDWAAGNVDHSYELGIIELDTRSNTVPSFRVDLDHGSDLRGFLSMLALGTRHIQEGTDHQLFLLALLIPAPLIAVRRRWQTPASTRQSVRRIGGITLAFTLGHSVTLALGALGLPVPQKPVEALIAVSIIVAAAQAFWPIFPGREALVAASFGLIHGLAFSETLRELHLSGGRLVLSLLGFNIGIEAMQLLIVALVLPPLVMLARARRYRVLRVVASLTAGVAAVGWLFARVGYSNLIADAADNLGRFSVPIVGALWLIAVPVAIHARVSNRRTGGSLTTPDTMAPSTA